MAVNGQAGRYRRRRGEPPTLMRGLVAIGGLAAGLAALALLLMWLAGPPQVPAAPPSLEQVRHLLTGSDLPATDVACVASSAAWLILAYLALSAVLRMVALGVLWWRGSTRAAWRLFRLTDIVTLPPIRRVTDGAVAGVILASAWIAPPIRARTTTASPISLESSAAAPTTRPSTIWLDDAVGELVDHSPEANISLPAQPQFVVPYTVVMGDSLWQIAQRFYGDGHRYPEIVAANAGRVMVTGESFSDPRVIRPGWVLFVPLPAANVGADGAELTYRVQPGDSLWRIAAHLLSDGMRWPEIWELNRDRDMGGGRAFTNPSVLSPGWLLRLPVAATIIAPETPPEPTPPPVPTPALPVPAPTASPTEQPAIEPSPPPRATPTLQESQPPNGRSRGWSPDPLMLSVGAAGVAVVGSAIVLARRAVHPERKRNSHSWAARRRMRGPEKAAIGDVERVTLASSLVLTALRESGFDEVRLLACREGAEEAAVLLACPPGEAAAVVNARFALGRRLSCTVEGRNTSGHQVELSIARLRREAAALFSELDQVGDELLLVPIGADDDGVHYVNLAAAGGVQVQGTEPETLGLLHSWLATLASSHQARSYEVAAAEQMWRTPHLADVAAGSVWHQGEPLSSGELLAALEAEMITRTADDGAAVEMPAIIAAIAHTGDVDRARLDTLVRRGIAARISFILVTPDGADAAQEPAWGACVRFVRDGAVDGVTLGMLVFTLKETMPRTLRPVLVRSEDTTGGDHPVSSMADRSPRSDQPDDTEEVPDPDGDHHLADAEKELRQEAICDAARGPQIVDVDRPRDADDLLQGPQPTTAWIGVDDIGRYVEPQQTDLQRSRAATRQLSLSHDEPAEAIEDPTGETPIFSVRCFGTFHVEVAGRPVTNWKIQKARELLAYLVVKGGTPVPREEAWEALWPEQDAAQMQRLLSDTAYHLRRALKEASGAGIEPLTTQGQRYHLRTELFRIDVTSFEAHLRRAAKLPPHEALVEYERALTLYRGNLLGAEPFEWAGGYRQEYETKVLKAAHAAADLSLRSGDVQRGIDFYRAVLLQDPIDEEAARGLMQCYASVGDTNGVRKVHKTLVEALRRELEDPRAEPLPETTKLWQQLLGRSGPGSADGRRAGPE